MFLIFLVIACENKSKDAETDYEEIVIRSYRYPDKIKTYDYYGDRLQINLIAQSQHYYRKVTFHVSSTAYINDDIGWGNALKDYPDTIYTRKSAPIRNFRIEIFKDTLTAFYMPIGGAGDGGINLNKEVGTIFHYCEDCSEEEKLETGFLLESEIFDTVFNSILPVRRCLHYSLYVQYHPFDPDSRWHIYYDVDRCFFVQVEHRTLDTNELTYISKVEGVKKIDSTYFNRHWNNAETYHTLMPVICPTNEL
jgi:hypothetical protein